MPVRRSWSDDEVIEIAVTFATKYLRRDLRNRASDIVFGVVAEALVSLFEAGPHPPLWDEDDLYDLFMKVWELMAQEGIFVEAGHA